MRFKIALIIAMIVMLCGCGESSIDASLRVPELPEEYVEFNDEISKIKSEGFELVSPGGGTNRQSVQLTDLDNDGIDEGVAFFKEISGGHKVYAYFFKKNDDGYSVQAKIEGSGDTVENVSYADLMGTGSNEVIIGWSLSDSVARSVSAYSVYEGEAVKLCEVNSLYHVICDLNNDMISDLCVVYEDHTDGTQKMAMYSQSDEGVSLCSSVTLSQASEDVLRIRAAYIDDMQPAVFVEKRHQSSGIVTDIIVWNETELKNMTYTPETGNSDKTARLYEIYCEDIDADGALEVPLPYIPSGANMPAEGQAMPGISWYGCAEDEFSLKAYTFRSSNERWNISLPLDWQNRCVAVYHKLDAANVSTFYSQKEGEVGEEIFSIIAITGENREKNMEKLGYEKLMERNGTLYAVRIKKKRYLGYDITPEMLTERFSYKETEWSTGEVVF